MDFDVKEYLDYTQNGVLGKLTRALVVSVDDPLYSGRVRVWIPTLHGGFYEPNIGDAEFDAEEVNISSDQGSSKLGSLTGDSIECLPWAPVIGHNWGATSDFKSSTATHIFGIFNIPKKGTEVYVIFEDDDPNLPVIIGSVFHTGELTYKEKIALLELGPGISISNPTSLSDTELYESTVAESYIIQSQKKSKFIISDIDGEEQIILGGSIGFDTKATITDLSGPASKYAKFTELHPNFPTTASAPFEKRSPINLQTVIQTATPFFGRADVSTVSVEPVPVPKSLTKRLPIKGSWKMGYKFGETHVPGGMVQASTHYGVDLSGPKTELVSPIDNLIPLAYRDSRTGGIYLLCAGPDGYCHAFLHLTEVEPEIIKNISRGIRVPYAAGTKLGITGSTGTTSTGPHLHWEVFYTGNFLLDSGSISNIREAIRKPGSPVIIKGTTIQRDNADPIYRFVDPIRNWMAGSETDTNIIMEANQIEAYNDAYTSAANTNYNKIIGLEISLVPGAEQIFMRHSSGAFAGFDADGNWKVFTPGNAEYRVNRSMVFDVLGGIMSSCLAVITRAKGMIKLVSPTSTELTSSIKNLPLIFDRIDASRAFDMKDALLQSTSNLYFSLADSTLGKSSADIASTGYASVFIPKSTDERDYSYSAHDSIIQKYIDIYVDKNHLLVNLLTLRLFKSIILKESNGIVSARGGNNLHPSIGLFQITSDAIETITGNSNITIQSYSDPENNIKIGVAYFVYCVKRMLDIAKTTKISVDTDESRRSILLAALMAYNVGVSTISKLYSGTCQNGITVSYSALEAAYIRSGNYTENHLYYAPHVQYILSNLK